jgi:hypothetical protein
MVKKRGKVAGGFALSKALRTHAYPDLKTDLKQLKDRLTQKMRE